MATSSPLTREEKLAKLREPFPSNVIGKLPRGNVQLDFVGHAHVTDRLLSVDPDWNWEPAAFGDDGLPKFILKDGRPRGLWIKLTVCGVTRLGFGSVGTNAHEPEKELIGDALRNAAMRFGVALDLWAATELESSLLEEAPAPKAKVAAKTSAPKEATAPAPLSLSAPASGSQIESLEQVCKQIGANYTEFVTLHNVKDPDHLTMGEATTCVRAALAIKRGGK